MEDKNGWIDQNTPDCIGREVVGGFITADERGSIIDNGVEG